MAVGDGKCTNPRRVCVCVWAEVRVGKARESINPLSTDWPGLWMCLGGCVRVCGERKLMRHRWCM